MPTDDNFEDGKGTGTATSGAAPGDAINPNPHRNLVQDALDTSPGKHALLMVPNFKAVGDSAPQMNSYLRLGNAHSLSGDPAAVELGEDLASLVNGFTDDLRDRGNGSETPPTNPEVLSQPPATAAEGAVRMDTDARRLESTQLHSKGGWRDHSDGNRITTTRGDKVEVIRGNYKLLVLGRSDRFDNVAGMEIAGGQIDDDSGDLRWGNEPDPGGTNPSGSRGVALNTTFEWFQAPDGNFGWKQTVIAGDPNAASGNNGQMITQTFIDLQDDTVNARQITTNTTVATQTDTLNAGTLTENVSADTANTNTSTGVINNVTTSRLIDEFTAVGIHDSCEISGVVADANIFHTSVAVDLGLVDIAIELAVLKLDLEIVATNYTFLMGTVIDNHMGLHLDTHSGVHVDLHSGAHLEIHAGVHAQNAEAHQFSLSVGDVTAIKAATSVEVNEGTVTLSGGTVLSLAAVTSSS